MASVKINSITSSQPAANTPPTDEHQWVDDEKRNNTELVPARCGAQEKSCGSVECGAQCHEKFTANTCLILPQTLASAGFVDGFEPGLMRFQLGIRGMHDLQFQPTTLDMLHPVVAQVPAFN